MNAKEVIWNGIIAHPDAIWREKDGSIVVIEIKTTESVKVTTRPYSHHIRQLKNYMAILDDVYET